MVAGVVAGEAALVLLSWRPSVPFRELVRDESPLVAVRAGNGTGKTRSAMWRVARCALSRPGTSYRVIGPSFSQMRDTSARYLWDFLAPYCVRGSEWRPGTGWTRHGVVSLRNGSSIELKAYSDKASTQEGRHGLEIIVLDEVPSREHYVANKGRAKQLIVLFTVQTQATPKWLRKEIEGGERSPVVTHAEPWVRVQHSTGWVQYVVALVRENVPHYDDLTFEREAGRHRGSDYEATRIWATWDTVLEERRFGGWSNRWVKSRTDIAAMLADDKGRMSFRLARYGLDYGNGSKQYQCLIAVRGERFFLLHEYVGKTTSTFGDHARALKLALEAWGLPGLAGLAKLDAIRGDVNSAGPGQGGDRLNDVFNRHLALVYGLGSDEELPVRARAPASKREGAKEVREIAINQAMLEGRWYVCDTCETAILAASQYEGGANDPHKDAVDAWGYAVQDVALLYERQAPAAKVRAR